MHCATESETGRLRKSAIRASTGSRRRTAMRRESQRTSPDPQRDKEAKQGEGGKRETEREKGAERQRQRQRETSVYVWASQDQRPVRDTRSRGWHLIQGLTGQTTAAGGEMKEFQSRLEAACRWGVIAVRSTGRWSFTQKLQFQVNIWLTFQLRNYHVKSASMFLRWFGIYCRRHFKWSG